MRKQKGYNMGNDSLLLNMLEHPEAYPANDYDQKIVALMGKVRDALMKKARYFGGEILDDEAWMVGLLFNEKTIVSNARDYSRASISAMIEFLDWALSIWRGPLKPVRVLINFLIDVGYTRILSDGKSWRGRTLAWLDNFNYSDLEAMYYYDLNAQRVYKEALCVFGLRQTLEHKFEKLVGFVSAKPKQKFSHDFWPKIVQRYVNSGKLKFSGQVDIGRVMRVYNWTNGSIHGMRTDFVWLVWKAFQVCKPLFMPMRAGGITSLVDSASITEKDFQSFREDAEKAIAKQILFKGESCDVTFSKPEVIVVNSSGKASRKFNSQVTVTINGERIKDSQMHNTLKA